MESCTCMIDGQEKSSCHVVAVDWTRSRTAACTLEREGVSMRCKVDSGHIGCGIHSHEVLGSMVSKDDDCSWSGSGGHQQGDR